MKYDKHEKYNKYEKYEIPFKLESYLLDYPNFFDNNDRVYYSGNNTSNFGKNKLSSIKIETSLDFCSRYYSFFSRSFYRKLLSISKTEFNFLFQKILYFHFDSIDQQVLNLNDLLINYELDSIDIINIAVFIEDFFKINDKKSAAFIKTDITHNHLRSLGDLFKLLLQIMIEFEIKTNYEVELSYNLLK
jgi:acyl carrier protein